jgi:hypothetical protein
VGEGAVGFGGDDRLEPGLGGAAGFHLGFEAGGDVELGLAGLDDGERRQERLLLDLGRFAHQGDLGFVLDDAEFLDQAGGGGEARRGDEVGEGVELGEVEVLGLDRAALEAGAADGIGGRGGEWLGADDDVGQRLERLELLLIAEVADEDGARGRDQQVALAAEEAGEVADVKGIGDQDGAEVEGREEAAESCQAARVGRSWVDLPGIGGDLGLVREGGHEGDHDTACGGWQSPRPEQGP